MGSHRKQPWPQLSPRIKVLCCWEHKSHQAWEDLSTGICSGMSHEDEWVTWNPWVRGNYSFSTGILSCCKPDLLKHTIPEMKHTPLKEGRRLGSGPGIPHPQPTSPDLTALPPWPTSGVHNHVKFLKLPAFLSSRLGWHFCFPLVQSFGYNLCLSIVLEDIIAHIETPTKFTQETLNDNWQRLSLFNPAMCLMRKAVLQNSMALDIITACAIIRKNVTCSSL